MVIVLVLMFVGHLKWLKFGIRELGLFKGKIGSCQAYKKQCIVLGSWVSS